MSMSNKHWSIAAALEQIDYCGFECEGGPLNNNIAYRWLKDAAKVGPEFWPGQGVYFEITAEAAGERLTKTVHYYIVGCRMDSDSEQRFWTYDLSNDPPAPYHYGTVQHRNIPGDRLSLVANADTPKSAPSLSPTQDRRASPPESSLPESNNQSETP